MPAFHAVLLVLTQIAFETGKWYQKLLFTKQQGGKVLILRTMPQKVAIISHFTNEVRKLKLLELCRLGCIVSGRSVIPMLLNMG